MKLLKEVDQYDEAKQLYKDQCQYFTQLSKNHNKVPKLQGIAAITFLDYFNSYISLESYWKSWSPTGAKQAGELLDVLFD